jgi:hypothetical protein
VCFDGSTLFILNRTDIPLSVGADGAGTPEQSAITSGAGGTEDPRPGVTLPPTTVPPRPTTTVTTTGPTVTSPPNLLARIDPVAATSDGIAVAGGTIVGEAKPARVGTPWPSA